MNQGWLGTLLDYLGAGGWMVMVTLVIAAMILWYSLGYRFLILRRGNYRSVRRLIALYERGDRTGAKGMIDSAVKRGLALTRNRGAYLRHRLDEAFLDYENAINKYSIVIRSVVIVSPLLGLLGTVGGMIETFDSLGDMSLFSQSGGIAGGISQALFTTQMGLAVALPGLIIGRVLDRRQTVMEMELDKIKDILCAEYA
jgi:biopolymer transport protein ExbB